MDGSRAGGSGDEQNGPNVTQNPFDPAALLGYSQYAAALSSASSGVFPHMSSAFSLFPPPSAMFPTSSSLPFGGLGSLGDGLLTTTSTGLDSAATGSTDWWRMAAARAQLAVADPSSGSGFFPPGLGGGLGSPLLGSMFSGLVPTTTSSSTVSSPATVTQSSPASSTNSHADPAARLTPAARRSKTSTPVQKVKNEARLNRDADSSPRRSTVRRDSLSSTSSVEHTPAPTSSAAAAVKSQLDCPSLESSLLSAEAAMYASSSLFFPFALPHLFGASSAAALPFPGLLPPVSSSTESAYVPPSLMAPPLSSDDRARSSASSKTSASSPHVTASPSRSRPAKSSHDAGERPDWRGARVSGRSVIVSPTSSVTSDPGGAQTPTSHVAERKPLASTWCPPSQSPPHKLLGEHVTSLRHAGSHGDASSTSYNQDSELTFSDSGAIDLSMKKPRLSSPSPVKPPPPPPPAPPCPVVSKPSTAAAAADVVSDQAMTDALVSLFAQQPAFGAAEQAALAQLIAGQQLAAAGGSDLSLSLAAAAAATAGLFPPVYDGVSGLFYPPSILAALAATAQSTPGDVQDKSAPSTATTGVETHRRSRGRRRGSRGRNSSVFISSLFQQQSTSDRLNDETKTGRRRGVYRGRQGRGRGRQRGNEALSMAYMELERRQYLEQMLQQHLAQVDPQSTTTTASAAAAAAGSGVSSKDAGQTSSRRSLRPSTSTSSRSQQRGTLTSKLLHHQSKLEQALTAGSGPADGGLNASQSLAAGIKSGGGAALMSNFAALATGGRQLTSSASLRTDSDAGNEETSSACSSDSEDGQSTQCSDASHTALGAGANKRKQETTDDLPVKKRRRTILDESVLRIPLEQGWQRETRVRSFTPRKILGDVLYITPCERKLRNYNELDKFLEKGAITELNRENFTFSTKVNIGRFFEQQTTSDEAAQWVLLTEDEVKERFVVIEERKKRIIENKLRAQLREEKRKIGGIAFKVGRSSAAEEIRTTRYGKESC